MTKENKPLTIEFAPGCFDNFEGTQEELDEMIAEIRRMVESGELTDNSHEMTDEEWDELPDDVKEQLMRGLDDDSEDPDFSRPGRLLQ